MHKFIISLIFSFISSFTFSQFVQVNNQELLLNNKIFEIKSIFFENTTLNGNEAFNHLYQNFDLYTLDDYTQVKKLGFNTIELELILPILKNQNAKQQIEWLKQQIEWAKSQDLKIILSSCGAVQTNKNIWNNNNIKQHTIDYWKKIATIFKDETTILGYKLLENPQGTNHQWKQIAFILNQKIRQIDLQHIIIIEQNHKPYFTLEDKNTLYHFSFLEPFDFTQQDKQNGIQKYPNEDKLDFPIDLQIQYIDTSNIKFQTGQTGWVYYEGNLMNIPDSIQSNTTVASPILTMSNASVGGLYFGEFVVEEVDTNGNSKEILRVHPYNNNYWEWYGNDKRSYFKQLRSHDMDNNDVLAIRYANELSYCYNPQLRFPVKKNYFYKISGWSRGEEISFQALNCLGLMIETSSNNYPILKRNQHFLKFYFNEFIKFKEEHNVPIYIQLKLKNHVYNYNRGGLFWMNDMQQIISQNISGYSYHNYISKEFGIYSLKKKGRKTHKNTLEYFQNYQK